MTPREAILAWFEAQPELTYEEARPNAWFTVLAGERKRTIPLQLSIGDHTLVLQSHFMRAPDENVAALYELLLKRHQRSYAWRFCVADEGDVLLVAVMPLTAVDTAEIDRLCGTLLTLADETFNAALRLGFQGYIEREQAWRELVGLDRNPIS